MMAKASEQIKRMWSALETHTFIDLCIAESIPQKIEAKIDKTDKIFDDLASKFNKIGNKMGFHRYGEQMRIKYKNLIKDIRTIIRNEANEDKCRAKCPYFDKCRILWPEMIVNNERNSSEQDASEQELEDNDVKNSDHSNYTRRESFAQESDLIEQSNSIKPLTSEIDESDYGKTLTLEMECVNEDAETDDYITYIQDDHIINVNKQERKRKSAEFARNRSPLPTPTASKKRKTEDFSSNVDRLLENWVDSQERLMKKFLDRQEKMLREQREFEEKMFDEEKEFLNQMLRKLR